MKNAGFAAGRCVQQVAENLGVRYVLEGSVRKSGETVRVTAQLVDALNGRHILSESFDREFKDILSVQDEIAMKILYALQVVITKGEFVRTMAKGTKNLNAYLKTIQAHQFAQQIIKKRWFYLERTFLARKRITI